MKFVKPTWARYYDYLLTLLQDEYLQHTTLMVPCTCIIKWTNLGQVGYYEMFVVKCFMFVVDSSLVNRILKSMSIIWSGRNTPVGRVQHSISFVHVKLKICYVWEANIVLYFSFYLTCIHFLSFWFDKKCSE